mmetsp:Transcript_33761/g.86574  ORF Transcript_33761/g.86574 Transcript_33761/m.86574 type:complete len:210 (+) Transcript_33761:419-1048(+)
MKVSVHICSRVKTLYSAFRIVFFAAMLLDLVHFHFHLIFTTEGFEKVGLKGFTWQASIASFFFEFAEARNAVLNKLPHHSFIISKVGNDTQEGKHSLRFKAALARRQFPADVTVFVVFLGFGKNSSHCDVFDANIIFHVLPTDALPQLGYSYDIIVTVATLAWGTTGVVCSSLSSHTWTLFLHFLHNCYCSFVKSVRGNRCSEASLPLF